MEYITNTLGNLLHQTAFLNLTWGNYLMILVALVFLYLAIAKGFEPLLPDRVRYAARQYLSRYHGEARERIPGRTSVLLLYSG